jgi:branched-chain amino acid transport system substrate-binding protein
MAAIGKDLNAGYEIAVEHINAAGGVYVKEFNQRIPLELVVLDNESDPVKVVSTMETLNTAHKVVAYLGTGGSPLNAAAAPIAEKNKIPYLGVAFGLLSPHKKGYKYLFSPFPKTPVWTEGLVKMINYYVPEVERPTKLGLFIRKGEDALEAAASFKALAPKYGYQIVFEGEFAPGSTDFSSLILGAKAAGVESLFTYPVPPEAFAMVKQMKELGWRPKLFDVTRGASVQVWSKVLGPLGDYVVSDAILTAEAPYPGVRELSATYQQKYGKPVFALPMSAYVCVQILADAIERAGTLDRGKIRDAIAATNRMTVGGHVTFNPDGTSTIPDHLLQWQDGKARLIWPAEVAATRLLYPAPPWK